MDGSQSPPLKFDQVEYQTQFEPPKTKPTTDNQRRRRRPADASGCRRAGRGRGLRHLLVRRTAAISNRPTTPISAPTASRSRRRWRATSPRSRSATTSGSRLATCWCASIRATTDRARQREPPISRTRRPPPPTSTPSSRSSRRRSPQAQAAVDFAEQELKRYDDLARTGAGSAQRQQQTTSDLAQRPAPRFRPRRRISTC